MKFYIHNINPHESAEHHDTCMEGFFYGIWEYAEPAISPIFYRVQSKNIESAEDVVRQLEKLTEHKLVEELFG